MITHRVIRLFTALSLIAGGLVIGSPAANAAPPADDVFNVLRSVAPHSPANDSALRKLAKQRADSLAKQNRPTSEANVDSGVGSLSSKGYGSSTQIKGYSTSGDASVLASEWKVSKKSTLTNKSYTRVGIGVSKSSTGSVYVVALYASYQKPYVAPKPKPKPVTKKPAKAPAKPAPKPVVTKPAPKPVVPKPPKKAPSKKAPSKQTAVKPKPISKPADVKPQTKPTSTPKPAPPTVDRSKEYEAKLTLEAEKRAAAEELAKLSKEERAVFEASAVNTEEQLMLEAEKRAKAEQSTREIKSTISTLTATTVFIGSGVGILMLLSCLFIRSRKLEELPEPPVTLGM